LPLFVTYQQLTVQSLPKARNRSICAGELAMPMVCYRYPHMYLNMSVLMANRFTLSNRGS